MEVPITDRIQRRRRQVLVHTFIRNRIGECIVEESSLQDWANELVQLQKDYPEQANEVEYAEEFKDFNGSIEASFNYDDKIRSTAFRLYNNYCDKNVAPSNNDSKTVVTSQKSVAKPQKKQKKAKITASRSLF